MTTIVIGVGDFGAQAQPGDAVILSVPTFRENHTGTGIVSTAPRRVELVDGSATVEDVEPGPLLVVFHCRNIRDSSPKQVIVPDSGTVTLAELMRNTFDYTPPIVGNVGEAAGEASDSAESASRSAQDAKKSAAEAKKSEQAAAASKDSAAGHAETATSAANTATSQAGTATQAASDAVDARDDVAGQIAAWHPKSQQLEKWQPQYEWLRENAADGFAKQQEIFDNAAASVRSEVTGLVEKANQAATTAGQYQLKAEAAANNAETAASKIVDAAIDELKGGAPEAWNTLKELADELQAQKSAAATLVGQLAEKAPQKVVTDLQTAINSLNIGSIKGLADRLADLAKSDVDNLNVAKSYADTRMPTKQVMAGQNMTAHRYGDVVTLRLTNVRRNTILQLPDSAFYPSDTTQLTISSGTSVATVTIKANGEISFEGAIYQNISVACTYVI